MKRTKQEGLEKPPIYIDTDRALERLVGRLHNQSMIAVDTESNPLFAYHEKLCLLQISTSGRDYIIDPLADVDLDRLVPTFADPAILKIFHDAEFDVLMLKRAHTFEFAGIFDTRVVASSLGLVAVGLAAILEEFFDVKLDKRHQRSDWGKRPLAEGQLDYAATDTRYLIALAKDLRDRLADLDPIHALEVAAECRRLEGLVPQIKPFDPSGFHRIKGGDRLNPKQRRVLRELFVLRHEIADKVDRPAFKVLSNEMLLKLAQTEPRSQEELKNSRILSLKLRERRGDDILKTIRRASKLAPIEKTEGRPQDEIARLTDEQRARYESLRRWRKTAAESRATDASLVLPRQKMVELAKLRSVPKDEDGLLSTGILEDWRIKYHGGELLKALAKTDARPQKRRRR